MDGSGDDAWEAMLERAAVTALPILLYGATGAGKDVTARRIHALSDRRARHFVVFNCAAIAASLAESLLFGCEKNTHSLAKERQIGLLESAGDGTIFLDEVAELSLELQGKLLRALDDDGEFLRVGGKTPVKLRARIIAATNKDLRVEVEAGRFRRDLYYRLAVLVIAVPPLALRPTEVLKVAREFLAKLAPELDFAPCALDSLPAQPWPGGFRELRSVIARIVVLGRVDRDITAADIRDWSDSGAAQAAPRPPLAKANGAHVLQRVALREPTQPPESRHAIRLAHATTVHRWRVVVEALDESRDVKRHAAKSLGISRQALDRLLTKIGHPLAPKRRRR
jgi:transcriptional regulator with GAF, ATPase, and Fis domain